LSDPPNCRAQSPSINQASTRIHHRDRVASNDEADVGYRILVLGRHVLVDAAPNMDSWGDLLCSKGSRFLRALCRAGANAKKARGSKERISTGKGYRVSHVRTIDPRRTCVSSRLFACAKRVRVFQHRRISL
jgi:hypothetical protein